MELEDAIKDFDKRHAVLDDVQSAVDLGVVEPGKLEHVLEAADHFRFKVRGPRVQAGSLEIG